MKDLKAGYVLLISASHPLQPSHVLATTDPTGKSGTVAHSSSMRQQILTESSLRGTAAHKTLKHGFPLPDESAMDGALRFTMLRWTIQLLSVGRLSVQDLLDEPAGDPLGIPIDVVDQDSAEIRRINE